VGANLIRGTLVKMSFPYLNDILHQPDALQDTLGGLRKALPLADFSTRLDRKHYRRIVLTGMGSSYHALYPLLYRLIQAGLNTQLIETSELLHHASTLLEAHTLTVVVSQSGRSAEVIRLLEMAKGISDLVVVTNTPSSPLAEQAQAVVLTLAGEEASVSCKTYLTALAALVWLGDALLPASPAQLPLLQGAPQLIAHYLSGWQGYVARLKDMLKDAKNMFLVGRGDSLAAAGTGGLIVKEAAHFAAEGMSSASFRHGPMEMLSKQVFVLVFQGEPQVAELNQKLAKDIRTAGSQVGLVQDAASLDVFHIPVAPTPLRPLLEILPVEMITLALADLQNREAGRFELGSKVTEVE